MVGAGPALSALLLAIALELRNAYIATTSCTPVAKTIFACSLTRTQVKNCQLHWVCTKQAKNLLLVHVVFSKSHKNVKQAATLLLKMCIKMLEHTHTRTHRSVRIQAVCQVQLHATCWLEGEGEAVFDVVNGPPACVNHALIWHV